MSDFLTTRQLQEILHVDRTTIYRMADDGRIPALKVGSQWRFPRRSIEGWLQTQSAVRATLPDVPLQNVSDLSRLLPVTCVQRMQDTFASLLGVMVAVTDLRGQPVTELSNPCRLFVLAERLPAAQKRCQQEWAALANQPELQPMFSQSHLGLLHTRDLIRVGSELKAMLVAGGIAPTHWPPDAAERTRMAEYLDIPDRELDAALRTVFVLTHDQKQQVLGYVQRIADIIAHIMNERSALFTKLQDIAELTRV